MLKGYRHAFYVFTTLFLVSCSSLHENFKEPTVSVTSFRAIPSPGMVPHFEICLHVTNPNRMALTPEGVSYTVTIEGHRILAGVANDLPVIEAYGEGIVTLTASADLISSISLLTDLMRQPRDTFTYELTANLDLGGRYSDIPIQKKGSISLAPVAR